MTPDLIRLAPLAGRPVVVGAGLAGMVAALELKPVPAVLISGGALGVDCASDWAQGGIAAAVGPDDAVDLHVADTLAAGAGLCDEHAVRRIVAAAPAAVGFLSALGARFDRNDDGTLRLGLEGAHGRHRIVHADGDGSGREIMRAMTAAVRAAKHLTVLEHTVVRRILTADDAPGSPVVGVELATSDGVVVLPTAAVVLATGGAGALFAHTTNPAGSWGSGLVLGLRAGAAARDLEMVQFHPTALDVGLDPLPLVSEAIRGKGAHLVDDLGHRVVDDDLASRDVVSRAVWARLEAGRRVYLDTPRAIGSSFHGQFPTISAACAAAGLDPAVDALPVRPAAHYHMGGLLTDADARTTVPGLWAVGEVASTGLHGANRLASNSLLEAVVTGRAAAEDVRRTVAAARRTISPRLVAGVGDGVRGFAALMAGADPADQRFGSADRAGAGGEPAPSAPVASSSRGLRPTWTDRMILQRACGVLRDETRLTEAVRTLRPGAEHHDPRLLALLLAWSALLRAESRGGHTRTDRPHCGAPRHHTFTLGQALADIDALLCDRHHPVVARSA